MEGSTINAKINGATTKALKEQADRLGLSLTACARMILTTALAKPAKELLLVAPKKGRKAS